MDQRRIGGRPRRKASSAATATRGPNAEPTGTAAGIPIDLHETLQAVQMMADQVSSLVRYIPDPQAKVPGSEWTFGETAAHIALGQTLFTELTRGSPSPFGDGTTPLAAIVDEFASVNSQLLAQFPERDGVRLADLINKATRSFCQEISGFPAAANVDCHFGSLDACTFASYSMFHLMLHGYPLARALSRPFPISREHALLMLPFLTAVMPFVATPNTIGRLRGCCLDIQVRSGPRFSVHFGDGGIRVEKGRPKRADCHLSADPVALLLVGTRTIGQWGPIAQGKLVAWGRKPWVALQFAGAFRLP
jgi:hypothetical protein